MGSKGDSSTKSAHVFLFWWPWFAVLCSCCGVVCASAVPAMFVMGDSIVDVGENNLIPNLLLPKANILPYGETFPGSPTGRWSDGRLIPDFLAERLSISSPDPYLKWSSATTKQTNGVNFASFGSGILDITGQFLGVESLPTQVEQFTDVVEKLGDTLGTSETAELLSKSLFVVITGNNDITDYHSNLLLQLQYPADKYVDLLVSSIKGNIETLAQKGARKILLGGVGPLGCVPVARATAIPTGSCVSQLNDMAKSFNSAMLAYVNEFNAQSSGSTKIVLGTIYDVTMNLIENGASEGFTEGFTACCGIGPFNGFLAACGRGVYSLCPNPIEHVFWDFTHPTESFYGYISEKYWNGNTDTIQPASVSQLIEA